MREGMPVDLEGSLVTLAFPKERGFHKASIEQEKHRIPAERVLSKFFGRTLEIRCVTGQPQDFRSGPKSETHGSGGTLAQRTTDPEPTKAAADAAAKGADKGAGKPPQRSHSQAKSVTNADEMPKGKESGEAALDSGVLKPDEPEAWDDTVQAALKAFGGKVVRVEDSQKGGS